jgi:hypothetical protein
MKSVRKISLMVTYHYIFICNLKNKKTIRQEPDCFDAAGGLERQSHFEYSPVAEPCERHDHITPEEQYVRSLGKFQVSQNDKKRSLQEKKQSHLDQISRKSHQANR